MTAIPAHLVWANTGFGLAVWGLCRLVPRLTPAARCTLWWAVCVQMLIAPVAAFPRIPPVWLGLWGAGLGVRLIVLGRQYRRARGLVRESVPLPPCAALEALTRLGRSLGVNVAQGIFLGPGRSCHEAGNEHQQRCQQDTAHPTVDPI